MGLKSIESEVSDPKKTTIIMLIGIAAIIIGLLAWIIVDTKDAYQKISIGNVAETSRIIEKIKSNNDITQKIILDKLTSSISSIEDMKKHATIRDDYFQSLVARIESRSIPEAIREKYLLQLSKLTASVSPKAIPLNANEYSLATKQYKEYILSVPMYIQDSEIRELMRIKALLRLSDVLFALTNIEITPKDARQEFSVVLGQYGDLFDQNETYIMDNNLNVAVQLWHDKRLGRAQDIIDDINKQKPKLANKEILHLAEDRLLDYFDIKMVEKHLSMLRIQAWDTELKTATATLESIKKSIRNHVFSNDQKEMSNISDPSSLIVNKQLLTAIISYTESLNDLSGDVWNEEKLSAILFSRRLDILQERGAIRQTLESLKQTINQLGTIMNADRMDKEEKLGALRLLQANNISTWLATDSSLLGMVEYVKSRISSSKISLEKKIQDEDRKVNANYISKVISLIRSVEICFDDHDDDWNKKVFSKAMLNIKTEQLPMPVYQLFQAINNKVMVDDGDLLEVAKYSVNVTTRGKKLKEAQVLINMGCTQ